VTESCKNFRSLYSTSSVSTVQKVKKMCESRDSCVTWSRKAYRRVQL